VVVNHQAFTRPDIIQQCGVRSLTPPKCRILLLVIVQKHDVIGRQSLGAAPAKLLGPLTSKRPVSSRILRSTGVVVRQSWLAPFCPVMISTCNFGACVAGVCDQAAAASTRTIAIVCINYTSYPRSWRK